MFLTSVYPALGSNLNLIRYSAASIRFKGPSLNAPRPVLQFLQRNPRNTPVKWQWSILHGVFLCPVVVLVALGI